MKLIVVFLLEIRLRDYFFVGTAARAFVVVVVLHVVGWDLVAEAYVACAAAL